MDDNIVSLFNKRLDGHSALKTALVFLRTDGTVEKYSWTEEYHFRAICVAEWLKSKGVKKSDFVAIIPLNLPNSFFAMLGIILIGAVPVPINVQLLKETGLVDLRKIIDDCKPKLVLASKLLGTFMSGIEHYSIEETIEKSTILFLALPGFGRPLTSYSRSYPTAKDDDLLIMPYTSGTSGRPKGVMLTQKNIINRLEAVTDILAATENERILSYLPLGHIAELIITFFGQIYSGYTVYFTEYSQEVLEDREKFRRKFASVLRRVKPTIFIAVPRIWTSFRKEIETKIKNLPVSSKIIPHWLKKHLIKRGLGFSQTRIFISAGAKISGEDLAFFDDLGIPILDIYGQTETAGPLTLNGMVIGSNCKVVVLENKEIAVSGDCVMAGYFQNQEANGQVFNQYGNERLYHTGDSGDKIAWLDKNLNNEKGWKIYWTGRVGNGFKLDNGEYINPDQIERAGETIRKIDSRIIEVIICGANRPHLVALIFCENPSGNLDLYEKIKQVVPEVGKGMLKIKRFQLLDMSELELTPTMKVKRNIMLEKFTSTINALYLNLKEKGKKS